MNDDITSWSTRIAVTTDDCWAGPDMKHYVIVSGINYGKLSAVNYL